MKLKILLGASLLALNLYSSSSLYQGMVEQVIQVSGYTYFQISEKNGGKLWVAVEKTEVKKGDVVRFKKELVSKSFKSKELKREFKELMFASSLEYKVN